MIWGAVLGLVGDAVGGWFEKKKLEQQTTLEVARGKLRLAQTQVEATAQWNQTMAEASRTSWKDEFVTVVFLAPVGVLLIGVLFMAMIGADETAAGMVEAAKLSVGALNELPEWFRYTVGAIVAAAIGREQVAGAIGGAQRRKSVQRLAEKVPPPPTTPAPAVAKPSKPDWSNW